MFVAGREMRKLRQSCTYQTEGNLEALHRLCEPEAITNSKYPEMNINIPALSSSPELSTKTYIIPHNSLRSWYKPYHFTPQNE
jgi:hypothetical protein